MRKFKLFTIAAAALMMAACSTDDIAQLFNGGKKNFTATIAAPGSGGTRTILEEDNNKITVKWAEGDEIALVHNGVKDVATVKSVDATTGKATITGTLTGTVNNNDPVKLIYPAAYVSGVSDGDPIYDDSKLLTQGGTLDYIQKNLDYRKGSGTFSDNGSEVTLNSAVKLESDIAIWKLTLKQQVEELPVALAATQVKIMGGTKVLASTATLATATSEVTLAMPTNLSVVGALTIEATDGEDTYTYTKADGVTFTANTYYQNTVTMTKKIPATVTTAPTAKTGVKAGENAAIINAGVASGGTMMYALTNTNTQPTSTDGFSATIPTAQSLAAGTYYVWYYVKADDTHADSDIEGSVSVTIAEAGISTKDASETFTPTANTVTGTYFKVSGIKMDNVWEIGGPWHNTITISSPDGLNLSQVVFTVGNQANTSQRNPSHLDVNHGTLTVTGTTPGNTVTISNIDSPSVTLSLPGSTNNAAKWTFTQAVVDGKGDASK